jgi:predicted O-methyltransferase YrrM
MIFLDHEKTVYLQDFHLLESYGVIKKGTIVIADNIIYPGVPNYLSYFKTN